MYYSKFYTVQANRTRRTGSCMPSYDTYLYLLVFKYKGIIITLHYLLVYFALVPACVASFFPGLQPFLFSILLQRIHGSCTSCNC